MITDALAAPWVLCGDFNCPAASWVRGAAVSLDPPVPTHPTTAPVEPIDYVVVAPGLRVEAEVLDTSGSDHLPVLGRVDLG